MRLDMSDKCICNLNSNPTFFFCLNTSFVFTNYQPRQCNASYNKFRLSIALRTDLSRITAELWEISVLRMTH